MSAREQPPRACRAPAPSTPTARGNTKENRINPADFQAIQVEKKDNGVVVARLNMPAVTNAIVGRMHTEMSRLVAEFDCDPATRVLVLTAAGDVFAGGAKESVKGWMKLAAATTTTDTSKVVSEGGDVWFEARRMIDSFLECSKPIISALHGQALSLGGTCGLLADVVVAGRSTIFGDEHVKLGLSAGDGGQVIWPLLIGPNRAKYYLMTGDRIDAVEAERLGLVNFLVDDDKVFDKAMEIANRLANGPIQAIIASKAPINYWMRIQSAQILPLSLAMERLTHNTTDSKEGLQAILEDREPNFTGK